MNIDIREPTDRDYSAWRALWEGYTQFYNSPQPETVTEHTWRRLLDPQSPVIGRVAVVEGEVLGFAICVLHEGTWVTTPVCYLEDLFVAPKARGRGVARTLYWHTRHDNPARRLYDEFTPADDYVRYLMKL